MDFTGGLEAFRDALRTESHRAAECAAAMEKFAQLWPAHAQTRGMSPGSTISCEVLVIGGGAAGVAAATAAGRAGAQVVLLERYGFLGGLATAAQVGTVCGLYLRSEEHTSELQ